MKPPLNPTRRAATYPASTRVSPVIVWVHQEKNGVGISRVATIEVRRLNGVLVAVAALVVVATGAVAGAIRGANGRVAGHERVP